MSDESQKVVSLRSGAEIIPPGTPRPNIIEMCEDLLERAKSGEIMGLAVVRLHSDGSTSHQHEGRNNYTVVGSLEGLKALLVEHLSD